MKRGNNNYINFSRRLASSREKTRPRQQSSDVPVAEPGPTSDIFHKDNADATGVEPSGQEESVTKCFEACGKLDSPAVKAIMAALNVQKFSLVESGTTGPRVLPPSSVWIAHQQPDFTKIRVAVLKALVAQKSSLIAVNESEETCDPLHFLAHLMGEMEGLVGNKRLHLLNVTITDPDLNAAFEVPQSAPQRTCSASFKHPMQSNLALEGSFVGPHVDHGTSGIIVVIGRCTKLLLVWPPSQHNRTSLCSIRKAVDVHRYDWSNLRGGYATLLDSSKALYLPPGWIHATITIKAGILLGRTFYEPYCALSTADCLLDDLDVATSLCRPSSIRAEDFDDIFQTLRTYCSEAFEVSLFESVGLTPLAAMNGWLKLEDELRKACKDANMSKLKLKRACKVIYERIARRKASTPPSGVTETPCPHHSDKHLNLEHFMEEHLLNFDAEIKLKDGKSNTKVAHSIELRQLEVYQCQLHVNTLYRDILICDFFLPRDASHAPSYAWAEQGREARKERYFAAMVAALRSITPQLTTQPKSHPNHDIATTIIAITEFCLFLRKV
ncbi:MAG: hypothetical protein Q9159_006190 [Coniocarpon cinnabarinum]